MCNEVSLMLNVWYIGDQDLGVVVVDGCDSWTVRTE